MGGTDSRFFTSSFNIKKSTGTPGVPLLKAELTKKRRRSCISTKGADQPAQTRKLVSDFVVQSLESIIDKLVTSKISAF